MKFPSEEVLEAAMSEIQQHQVDVHEHHVDGTACEFCELCNELSKRNSIKQAKDDRDACFLDTLPAGLAANVPAASIMVMMGGETMAFYLILLTRICFLLGMKAQKCQSDQDALNAMMEQ